MGNKVSLEDEMVNLRIVSKQMQRSAKKCEKNEKSSLEKLKKVSHEGAVVSMGNASRSNKG
jgi:charged multivesicular body protein 1